MNKVSVIIATYNSEKFLQRALDSLKNQEGVGKLFDLELIVVDDCSTDATLEILSRNNIVYFSTGSNSGGPNKGRNIALQKVTGDYIVLMDHDDEWLPTRIKRQLDYVQYAPIVTCGYNIIERDQDISRLTKTHSPENFKLYRKNETFLDKISKVKNKQITYLGSIMIEKSLKHHLFEEHFGQIDFDWIARIFENNESVEVCEKLYNRYVLDSNLSLNNTYRLRDYYYSLLTLENYKKAYPKAVRLGRKRINGSRARYHYLTGDMKQARHYFLRSPLGIKTLLFILTSFVGYKYVIKKFNFFG